VIAPPGLGDDRTRTLRAAYLEMVSSKDYQHEAGKRGFDIGTPNSGEALADYVATKLTAFPAETVAEYRQYVERK
jgi:hypothetical protein